MLNPHSIPAPDTYFSGGPRHWRPGHDTLPVCRNDRFRSRVFQNNELFRSIVDGVGRGGGGREETEPGKGDQLHETVQGPAQSRAEEAVSQPVHGRLEPLRQGR